MAGYSDTPLLKKLGIKDADRVLLWNAPAKLPEELRDLAEAGQPSAETNLDLIVLFSSSMAEFQRDFALLCTTIQPNGTIWAAWPKKTSGLATDLTGDAIRNHVLQTNFVDTKVCAIDETWSGLKFVLRKELRGK